MRRIFDFNDGLSSEQKKRLRQTSVYRRFIKERKRVSVLAEEHVLQGGSYSDPIILKEAKDLEALGAALQQKITEIKTEAGR